MLVIRYRRTHKAWGLLRCHPIYLLIAQGSRVEHRSKRKSNPSILMCLFKEKKCSLTVRNIIWNCLMNGRSNYHKIKWQLKRISTRTSIWIKSFQVTRIHTPQTFAVSIHSSINHYLCDPLKILCPSFNPQMKLSLPTTTSPRTPNSTIRLKISKSCPHQTSNPS